MRCSLNSLDNKFNNNQTIANKNQMHWPKCGAIVIAATCSGILYWNTSAAAEDRYGVLSTSLLALCGCLTNIAFNLESYLTTSTAETAEHKKLMAPLRRNKDDTLKLITSIISGCITTLPLWYIGLKGGSYLTTNISSIFNLPIYTDSALTLINWLNKKSYLSRLHDNYLIYTNCHSRSEQAKKRQEQRHKRNNLCNTLNELLREFSNANTTQRQEIKNAILSDEEHGAATSDQQTAHLLTAIRRGRQTVPTPELDGSKKTAFRVCFSSLFATGLFQNFGFTVQSYNASLQFLHDAFQFKAPVWIGIGFSFVNLLTSVGFSIKGLGSLYDILLQLFSGTGSLEKKLIPNLYLGITALFCITALFSGTGSDQASYLAWKQVSNQLGGEAAAWVAGIAANIGAALAYNLPQCLFLVDRIMQVVINRSNSLENKEDLIFTDNIKTWIEIIENLPLEAVEVLYDQSREGSSEQAATIPQAMA